MPKNKPTVTIISEITDESGAISFTVWHGGDSEIKKIPALSEAEANNCKIICTADGMSVLLCLYRTRNVENFFERVVGYRCVCPSRHGVKVRFFERKA